MKLSRAILANIALGITPAVLGAIFAGFYFKGFLTDSLQGILYANCIGLPCWAVMPRVLCALENRAPAVRLFAGIGILAFFGVIGCLAANLLLVAFGIVSVAKLWTVFFWSVRICLLITIAYGLITSAILTLQGRLNEANRALQERQLAEERAQKMAMEARFASLESRVHPHFLFNTLNSISALVREDPRLAERMIERLSALLRYSLDSEQAGLVPLGEELRIVQDYLEIEKVRFGARLRYAINAGDAGDAAAIFQVPPLSVQTLVENSVKYAVATRREGAAIRVDARVLDGKLRIEVSDDGPGFDPASSLKPGHGLDLLKRRLTALFGPSASLEVRATEGQTQVEISVAAA